MIKLTIQIALLNENHSFEPISTTRHNCRRLDNDLG